MKLETERLIIRPWTLQDVEHYQAMSKDVGYNCFTPPGFYLVKDDEAAKEKIQARMKIYSDFGLSKFPLFEKSTGAFVGTAGGDLFDLDGKKEVELGYRLMLQHWGKGYATEASKALLSYFFDSLKIPRVYGFAVPQNPQSLKILEKVGFVYQREFMWAGLPHRLYCK